MAINNQINITLDAKDNASSKFDGLSKSAGGFGSKLKGLGGPLKAIGVSMTAFGAAAGAASYKMYGIAENVELTVNKAKTVFGEYYGEMQKFADETGKAMGLSRAEYLKAAAGIQDLLIPMGFTREEATKNTQELMSLSGALAEWSAGQYNAAQVGQIFASAMLGEREQLKSLGISISAEEVSLRALENTKKGVTFATEQQSQAYATQQLIFEKSTDAQTAYANGTESLTRKKQEMIATLGNLKETLATSLIPAFGETVKAIQPVLEKTAKSIELWFQNKENVDKLTTTIKTIVEVFGLLFKAIGEMISLLYSFGEALGLAAFYVVDFSGKSIQVFQDFREKVGEIFESMKASVIAVFQNIQEEIGVIFDKMLGKAKVALQKAKDLAKEVATLGFADTKTFNSSSSGISGTKANGGDVQAGKSYLVGERGSEIFTPRVSGTISSSRDSNASGVTINLGGVSVYNEADEDRLIQKMTRAIQLQKLGIS